MAIRMHLSGIDLAAVTSVFGSKNGDILVSASDHLSETMGKNEQAHAWLEKLVNDGPPERKPQTTGEDGLLVTLSEGQTHVFAFHSLVQAVCGERMLPIAGSDYYHHGTFPSLYDDMQSCGFYASQNCTREFRNVYCGLTDGTPLFGHRFETGLSFYSIVRKEHVGILCSGFREALVYEKPVENYPFEVPAEALAKIVRKVSEEGAKILKKLLNWFEQIREANLDAYVIWE